MKFEYDSEYVEKNLIAYIGNKRRLLNLIFEAVKSLGLKEDEKVKFLDLFAGTGVVSRFAKSLGFDVVTNDWEYYSYVMNKAFLENDDKFLEKSFVKLGGLDSVISFLNALEKPGQKDVYISEYYCPKDDSNPNPGKERMFYTNYNGKKIDAIRAQIDKWFDEAEINEREKNFLIALLIYEASTRSNTSGVFKGFHNGFGGSNGDALTRILKKLSLNKPKLISGGKCKVYKNDALELAKKLKNEQFDITYLDPPYNQHQYGSNYHLLNTIALNDKPQVNKQIELNGKKVNKSAIRKDWVKTKSDYCYRKTALENFKKLICSINSRYILLSYSTDGIIDFDELLKTLIQKGKLRIVYKEYCKYRGGKQALTTEISNIEFILVVDTSQNGEFQDIVDIQKTLIKGKIKLLLKKTANPMNAESIGFKYKNKLNMEKYNIEKVLQKIYNHNCIEFYIKKNRFINFDSTIKQIEHLSLEDLEVVYNELQFITNLTKEDEIYLAINEIKNAYVFNKFDIALDMFNSLPYLLSKFNNRKAYVPSLSAILSVLEIILSTEKIWQIEGLLDQSFFKKIEKMIMIKLNLSTFDNETQVGNLKNSITDKYEKIIDRFSGLPNASAIMDRDYKGENNPKEKQALKKLS